MAIDAQEREIIVNFLNQRTGWPWSSNGGRISCETILQGDDRHAVMRAVNQVLIDNGIPSLAADNNLRSFAGRGIPGVRIQAEFTLNSDLLNILHQADPLIDIDSKKEELLFEHTQIADMLTEKTEYPWTNDIDGVRCTVKLPAPDRFAAERIFIATLTENEIPKPQYLESSARGGCVVTAQISSAVALEKLLGDTNSRGCGLK